MARHVFVNAADPIIIKNLEARVIDRGGGRCNVVSVHLAAHL